MMKIVEGKVVLLGSQAVGKTSLLMSYINKGSINPHNLPTIGASYCNCNVIIGNMKIVLQIWDTAGMERFRSMAPIYYRNANAALLVFDLTDYDTFIKVKSWACELKRNIEGSIILIVVGNKLDRVNERKVDSEEARNYATSIGALYYETSALRGDGIEDVFQSTAFEMLRLTNIRDFTGIKVYKYNLDDRDEHTIPSSEESFHTASIAHGIREKPFFCC